MRTSTTTNETFRGLGRADRRRLIKQWRLEGKGLSLKEWARKNALVGTYAQAWIGNKQP